MLYILKYKIYLVKYLVKWKKNEDRVIIREAFLGWGVSYKTYIRIYINSLWVCYDTDISLYRFSEVKT